MPEVRMPEAKSLEERKLELDRERLEFDKRWLNRYTGLPAALVALVGVIVTLVLSYNQLVLSRAQSAITNDLARRQQEQKAQEMNLNFGKLLIDNKEVLSPANAGSPTYDGFWKVMTVLYTEQSKQVFDALQDQAPTLALNDKVGEQRARVGLAPAKRNTGGTLYIQYQAQGDLGKMQALRARLQELGWSVPGLNLQSGTFPNRIEVRFFHIEDQAYGKKVAAATQSALGRPAVPVFVSSLPDVLSRTCEIWVPAGRS